MLSDTTDVLKDTADNRRSLQEWFKLIVDEGGSVMN